MSTDAPSPDAALERARQFGIHRLQIPTPFAVGRVNCYLFEGEPLTLLDAGPNSGKSLDEVARQLEALGHGIEELELIVVSHQHLDHFGLVDVLAGRSGAEVAAIDVLAPFLERYETDAELEDEFASELMFRHGIPEELVIPLRSVSAAFRGWGSAATVTRTFVDGERIVLGGRPYEAMLRPGHSPSDTLFWDRERRLLLSGDHLLGHISSNPLLARRLDGSGRRTHSLVDYLGSMRATRALGAELVLPGHGDPITEPGELIEQRFEMHRRRAAKLHRLIAERPRTAYELAQELWGNVAVTQAFLTLSEVIGHTDLLVDAGLVVEVADGEVVHFEPTGRDGKITIPLGP